MYYPPLFTSVRSFEDRNPLGGGGTGHLDVPTLGRENNPLDLSTKTAVRQAADAVPTSETETDLLQMLDHRKLAGLTAMSGRQPPLVDPATLFRLSAYGGADAIFPPPFCFDRTTGAAVPTSLATHPLMSGFLQQQSQQRERNLEQQQLYAARTTAAAAQQAAVAAAAAAAFVDPTLSLHLRGGLSQREVAALAASRGLYAAPALPTPMVLPAFSLYTEDKGAFTSIRAGGDKGYLNGTATANALEVARFAEQLHRLREQHLQAGKCNNACCTGAPLGLTQVPCACCIQSPSQAALCARSPMGCLKDPTTAATGKACEFLPPGLTFLHRPTAATATPSDLRLSVPSFCASLASTEASNSMFQPSMSWSTGLPTSTTSGKTAFSVPKKKETTKDYTSSTNTYKDSKKDISDKDNRSPFQDVSKRDFGRTNFSIKVEPGRKEEKDVMVISEESPVYHRKESSYDVKSLTSSKPNNSLLSKPSPQAHSQNGVALTTVTNVTPTVPTKCEGGTIPITKMPPHLEPVRPTERQNIYGNDSFIEASTSVPSPQGPPPLITAANRGNFSSNIPTNNKIRKIPYTVSDVPIKAPVTMYHSSGPTTYKSQSNDKLNIVDHNKGQIRSPKKTLSTASTTSLSQSSKINSLPAAFIKEEPNTGIHSLPKPIPHLPSPHSAHFASHYRPQNHLLNLHSSWIPPAYPNVTVAATTQSQLPLASPVTNTTTSTTSSMTLTNNSLNQSRITPERLTSTIKREPDYVDTPNVLQSLLIRSGPNLPQPAYTPSTIPTIPPAQSVIMPNMATIPVMNYSNHAHTNLTNNVNSRTGVSEAGSPAIATTAPLEKHDIKTENGYSAESLAKIPQKRPAQQQINADDRIAEKKRILNMEYAPVPGYTFTHTPYLPVPECPYTFIPESAESFKSQVVENTVKNLPVISTKTISNGGITSPKIGYSVTTDDENAKPADFAQKLNFASAASQSRSPKIASRFSAIKAKRKLRRRLLARLYQKRRPLSNASVPDRTFHDKEITVQCARKLLTQITRSWQSRRYWYKNDMYRKKNWSKRDRELSRKKRKVQRRLICKLKKDNFMKRASSDTDESPSKVSQPGSISMPSEMKRLMVNKALGETVLHRAARLGYPEVVAYCLETSCANVNARDNAGYTPLHECCSRGHLDIARALLQYGADVNASAAGGIRPLHDAVENDHVEVVRLLLSFGADPSIATYSGLIPLKLARSALMAEFLQGFMADISGEIENRPHLPWRFWGSASCLDPEDNGYDVFDGVPRDDSEGEGEGEGDDFLFEVSDSPHLPTFRLPLPAANNKAHCNYLRLSDVLRKTSMTKDYFLENYRHIEVLTLPRHEFEASATCSQLLTGSKWDNLFNPRNHSDRYDNGHTVDLVRLDNNIRQVLGIETISVR